MKKIRLIFLAMTMLISAVAFGQNITVTGVVKDSSTDEGVPFASLQEPFLILGIKFLPIPTTPP